MRTWLSVWLSVALVGGGLVQGCGESPNRETTPRRTVVTEPARPVGPPKRLMPLEKKPEVDQVFKANTGELEKCYSDFAGETGKTKLRGTLIIAVTIGWRRVPSKVWFLRNDFQKYPKLTRCFLEHIRQWEFPTWGGEMDYSFPRLRLEEM